MLSATSRARAAVLALRVSGARFPAALLSCVLLATSLLAQVETSDDLAFLAELRHSYQRGGSWSAQRDLAEYLLDFPSSTEARELAARAALDRGRLGEAEAHLGAVAEPDARLLGELWLRRGDYEEVLQLGTREDLAPMWAARLRVAALDGLGRRVDSLGAARALTDAVDDRELDGLGLLDFGWLLLHQRRFEAANQAFVYADRELNGLRGPGYELRVPEALVLLGRVYAAARQTGTGGVDRALSTLDEVLKLDAGHPGALVVRALTFDYGRNSGAVEAALDQALSRDPELPEALVLRGRARLMARRPSAALELAEQVLELNPRHRGALALAVAATELRSDRDAAVAAADRFLERHPESAEAARLLGEVLQAHYRFEDSLAPLRRALVIEPDDETPLPILAQSLANLGRFPEAAELLREHERRSPFSYPWRGNMLALLSARRELDEMSSPLDSFRLQLEATEREIYGRELGAWLEDVRAEMGARWGSLPEDEVLIEVYDGVADFSVRTVGFEGFLAFGVCFGDVVTIVSPLSELRGQLHWKQTALHEYAHVVTLGLSRQRMPRWLSEGISVLEERRHSERWARPLARDVLQARANGRVFPVERLDEAFTDGRTVMLGYYLGYIVADVVERDFGFDALRELVLAYGRDLETPDAIRAALGVEPAELDRRVLAFIDDELAPRTRIDVHYDEQGKDLLRERVRAGDAEALIELACAYQDLGRAADRDAALTRAERELGSRPRLQRLRARMAWEAGDREGALDLLRLWVLNDDADVDADGLLWFATALLQAGGRDASLTVLRRARELHPDDVQAGGVLTMLWQLLDPDDSSERAEWLSVTRDLCRLDEATVAPRQMLVEQLRAGADAVSDDEVLVLLDELVTLDPYDPERRLRLAAELLRHHDVETARHHWRIVLSIGNAQLPQDQVPGASGVGEPDWRVVARKMLDETEPEGDSAGD